MQHKWTDKEGVKHNFCIKCGVKKTAARRRHCNVSLENWKKNIKHDLKGEYLDYYGRTLSKCKNCGIEVNKRWSSYCLVTDDNDLVYVPYVEYFNVDGKVIRRCYNSNTPYQQKKQKEAGQEIKFWLVGCAYTEDELQVRDIIL